MIKAYNPIGKAFKEFSEQVWKEIGYGKTEWVLAPSQPEIIDDLVEGKSFPSDTPNKEWTVVQLKDYAKENGIRIHHKWGEAKLLEAIENALQKQD